MTAASKLRVKDHTPSRLPPFLRAAQRSVGMCLALLAALLLGCTARPQVMPLQRSPRPPPQGALDLGELTLVESRPSQSGLLPAPSAEETQHAWLRLIQGAKNSLDLAHFYVSNEQGARLEPVLQAIEQAVQRNVRVRLLVDKTFARFYPASLARLAAAGVQVRQVDYRARTGGVHHAKYLLVDGRFGYVGSANLDWRSLEHIHELGIVFASPTAARGVLKVFAYDWAWAQPPASKNPDNARSAKPKAKPATAHEPKTDASRTGRTTCHSPTTGETLQVVASPVATLPAGVAWEWPQLKAAIESAKERVVLQSLSYSTENDFHALDRALRQAAKRGVVVELMVASWIKNKARHRALRQLATQSKVRVWVTTVPPHSSGFIPYARVIHAKYVVVDKDWVWLGSSNLGGSYFSQARNLGLILRSQPIAQQLLGAFAHLRKSPHCRPFDPTSVFKKVKVAAKTPATVPTNTAQAFVDRIGERKVASDRGRPIAPSSNRRADAHVRQRRR